MSAGLSWCEMDWDVSEERGRAHGSGAQSRCAEREVVVPRRCTYCHRGQSSMGSVIPE